MAEVVAMHSEPSFRPRSFSDISGTASRRGFQPKIKRSSSFQYIVDHAATLEHAVEKTAEEIFLAKTRAKSALWIEAPQEEARVSNLELGMWVLFGASGWWSCNAVFAELPFFVGRLPEAEKLGSQLSVMTQLGNVFLIAYKLMERHVPDVGKVIHLMMGMALVALVACAAFWDTLIWGYNFPLLFLMIIAGGVGCMSNATYWAFIISYPAICTKAVGLGMSAGGVFDMLLAALQMAGRPANEPRFGARTFFCVAAVLQALWWFVAFLQQRSNRTRQRNSNGMPSRQDSSDGGLSSALLDQSDAMPEAAHSWEVALLNVCSFCLHGATYTLPSLLPFVASAYPEMKQQLLLWMLMLQQVGESLGRVIAPVRKKWGRRSTVAFICLTLVFIATSLFALRPSLLARAMPYRVAVYSLPATIFSYYISYGITQTAIFIRIRHVVPDIAAAERASSTMGFLGQMGALSANLLVSIIVNS